jgi:heterodisulfide reductase subunit A2
MPNIGIYLCQCGGNIADIIRLPEIEQRLTGRPDIKVVRTHGHMCSGAGQKMILDDVREHSLDRVVVAACSPQFHEKTFRTSLERAGLNPWMLEIANFREHCSWAHRDQPDAALAKAADLLEAALAKVSLSEPLTERVQTMGDETLVIGGGVAGLQAALDLADCGKKVTIVERKPTLGGHMTKLTKTFPTEDCAACIISPKMAEAQAHPNITVLTSAEVESLRGHRLHFEATIRIDPRHVRDDLDMDQCLICGECANACPISVPDEWQADLATRKAVYIPADLAIPYRYLVDREHCLQLNGQVCGKCAEVCPQNAFDFEAGPRRIERTFDVVIVATGHGIFDAREKPVFGYGKMSGVVSNLEMERIVDTLNGEAPLREPGRRVAFVQCVGSRDEQVDREYCSRICCMISIKQASLLKQARPETDIYVFYTDLRAFGKGYEEYYKRAQGMGVKFVRGKPAFFTEENGVVTVTVEETLSREIIEGEFDLVVLANGLGPNPDGDSPAAALKLTRSPDRFLKEAHPKYKPVDTLVEGVFLAGTAQGPKDIPDTVTQASAAASRALGALARGKFTIDPVLGFVHPDLCDACGQCRNACPVHAIAFDEAGVASVNEALCVGCGACLASCPTGALDLHGYTNEQLSAQVRAVLAGKKPGETRILVFADDSGAYRLIDALGVRKMKYPHQIRTIRIPAACRLTSGLLILAFEQGADAVYIGDSPTQTSRFEWGGEASRIVVEHAENKLSELGITGRIVYSQLDAGDLTRFVREIEQLLAETERIQ